MDTLTLYRAGNPTVTVNIDEDTYFHYRLMGKQDVRSTFISSSVLDIAIGDYITYSSVNYYVNKLPTIKKFDESTYQYKIIFEAAVFDLEKKLFINSEGLLSFSSTDDASGFIAAIVACMNTVFSGWTAGSVPATDEMEMRFSNDHCGMALAEVARTFGLEWQVTGKAISLVTAIGSDTAITFEYGKNSGLYQIQCQYLTDTYITTKVYGFGGTTNIPDTYRSRAKQLIFASRFLTNNVATYGTIEGQYTNDNIYPKRSSTLTSVNIGFSDGEFNSKDSYLVDSALDFDLNNYFIEGKVAGIYFRSGALAGNVYEIYKYKNDTKRIYINECSDKDGYTTPSVGHIPAPGDTYELVNIALPQSYVTAAETALQTATQAYLDRVSVPLAVYSIKIDSHYAKSILLSLHAGDKVTIVDTALGINEYIRVSEIEYPLTDPYKITATVSNFVPLTAEESIAKTSVSAKREAFVAKDYSIDLADFNESYASKFKADVFTPDKYFKPINYEPYSIEPIKLATAVKASDFQLSGVTMIPNYQGDPNAFNFSEGKLIHNTESVSGIGGNEWAMSASNVSGLDPAKDYYVYAKCDSDAASGTWIVSETPLSASGIDGYTYFPAGMIYAVEDGARDTGIAEGTVYFDGRLINSGQIASQDGNVVFDVSDGTFSAGSGISNIDFNVTTPGVVTISGGAISNSTLTNVSIQSLSGDTFVMPCWRGNYDGGTTYYKGDQVFSGGSSWIYVNDTPSSGNTPVQGAYWEMIAAQGLQGVNGYLGEDGAQGIQGIQGPIGTATQGTQGVQGLQGRQGTTGIGTQGADGESIQGVQGIQGRQGTIGNQGTTGADGDSIQGVQGIQGRQGTTGTATQGTQGIQGIQGIQGLQGRQGTTGIGSQGTQGTQGSTGSGGLSLNNGSSNRCVTSDSTTVLNGEANMTFSGSQLYVTGTIVATSTMTGTNFILSSDERLKLGIKKFTPEPLDVTYRTFEHRNDMGQKRYGVIAQELIDKYPELIRTDDLGFLSVSYIDLFVREIVYLKEQIKAILDGSSS